MTITVTSVANTQSFGAWLSTTNRLVEIVSQNTVTVDTSTGGSLSTGNGYVNGYFGANYLYVANGLSGGNVSSNGVLDIVSNVAFKYSTSNLVTLTANSTESVLNINVTNVNITANTISITGNTSFSNAVNFSEAVTFANAVNMTSTSPSVFSSNVTVSGTVSVGNSTVNTTINSTAFGISNSTVSYSILAPTAAQYANNDYYLNANGQWSRVVTGSNTYIQFNDSETLGSSSSLTFNKTTSTLNVGTFTANSTVVNSTAYNIGSNFIANSTGVYTGTVNAASHTVGTSTIANATGVFTTGTVNGATISVGTSVIANTTRLAIGTAVGLQANGGIGTTGQILTSNGTTVYWNTPAAGVAGSDTQIQFNDAGTLAGDTGLTFNKTTDTLSTNTILVTSTINAASHTVGTSTIANSTGVYTGTVNAASHTVGTSTIANSTGVYTGTVNAASYTVGTSFIANTTTLYHIGPIYSNNLYLQGDGIDAYIRATTGVLYLGAGSTNYFAVTAAGGGSFIPTTDNLYNLGSSTNRFANIYTTGTINAASHTVGTSTIANSTGVYTTGTVNGSSITVGNSVIANTTRLALGTTVGLQANGNIGTAGQILTSNGTTVYWNTPSASVAGSDTQVQFNNAGSLAGDAGLTYNLTTDTLSTNAILVTSSINAASHTVGTSTIANASGVYTTGTVNGSSITVGTSIIANTSRLVVGTAVGLQANGGIGTAGQVLTSNGTTVYWGSAGSSGTVTNVATGNGLTGGPITTSGTVSVLANSGIIANTTGLFVFANTGLVANATGVHVNTTYIATLAANSATFLGGSGNFGNTSGIYTTGTVNGASITVGTSTIANATGVYTGVVNGSSHTVGTSTIANSTGVYTTGTVNGATISVGTSTIANSTGVYTGVVNGSSHTVGTSTIANSTGVYTTGTVNGASITTSGIVANTTGVFPVSNTTGTSLGATGNRWVIIANSVTTNTLSINSSNLILSGNLTTSGAFSTTLIVSNTTSITLPTTGTIATLAGTETLTNKTITSATMNGNTDISGSFRSNIVAVSALDIDCSNGNYFTKTINTNSTFTFSNPPSSRAYSFTLELTHTSGSVTWPTAVKFPSNTAPTLTTGKTHLFMFVTDDAGTRWRGSALTDYDN